MSTWESVPRKYSGAHFSETPTKVICRASGKTRQGSIRDVTATGAFVYADFLPEIGTAITLDFSMQSTFADARMICYGTVVRVEQSTATFPTGIALEFSRVDIAA